MAEAAAFKYRAFISYSHADTSWAKWLHRALESFTIDKDLAGRETANGPVPKSLRPIFRDRDEFTAGHALSDQTQAALDASHALIVICSPASAKSRYVDEEVRLFKSRHPNRPVIPLIVAGKPGDAELECFPPALKFKLDAQGNITDESVELLAADVREEGDGKSLALAKVVAGLLGVSSDDIFRRAQRERRRRQQRWIAGLSVVAIALAGLAVWAEINRREAVAQREEAERNFEIAKQGANSLVFDIAQALRGQEGMRTETVRKILGTAEQVIGKLVARSNGNNELLHLQTAMLDQFAQTYFAQGDVLKAEEATRGAIAIAERLANADPGNKLWQYDLFVSKERLGHVLETKGDLEGALNAYGDSLAIMERLAKSEPSNVQWQSDLPLAYKHVGDVLRAQSRLDQALQAYRDGLAIAARLVNGDPHNAKWQSDLATAHVEIGAVLQHQDNLADALKSYEDGLVIFDRLAKAEPENVEWQYDLGICNERVGHVLEASGDLPGALKAYEEKRAIVSHLLETDLGNTAWQGDLALADEKIGYVLKLQGKLDEALQAYQKGLPIRRRLAETDPGNAAAQRELAVSFGVIGDVYRKQGNLPEALRNYGQGVAIAERLAKAEPQNPGWQRDLVLFYVKAATALDAHGDRSEAIDRLQQARAIVVHLIEQFPDDAQLPKDLAEYDAEIARLQRASAVTPGTHPEQAAQ